MARQRKRPARRPPYLLRLMHARPRLLISIAIGIAVTLALSLSGWRTATRIILGWDAGVALYLLLTCILMARSTIAGIREHAAQDDEGRIALLVLTVLAALASLGVIIAELGIGDGDKRTGVQLALATVTIFLSWVFIHTIFALNYAHDYYGEHGAKRSGLKFPDDENPDYWDFVYFSFVVGMTCQVSDVAVASQPIRRTVIAHGVVSFFFNTALLALTVIGGVAPANAQGTVRSVHNDWQIRCDTPPGAQGEQCALIQSVTAEDRANVGLTVIVLKTADQKSRLMRVVAPMGVLLPSGLGLKIDQADVGRAGFVRCLPNGCVAEVVMDENLVKQMRTGQTATFIIFQTPEEGIGFPMSLKGFGEGYDKLP